MELGPGEGGPGEGGPDEAGTWTGWGWNLHQVVIDVFQSQSQWYLHKSDMQVMREKLNVTVRFMSQAFTKVLKKQN